MKKGVFAWVVIAATYALLILYAWAQLSMHKALDWRFLAVVGAFGAVELVALAFMHVKEVKGGRQIGEGVAAMAAEILRDKYAIGDGDGEAGE